MSEAKPAAAPSAASSAKKGKGKLLIIVGAVVVLLGGGGGAFFMLRTPAVEATDGGGKSETVKKKKEPEANGIITFEPFVVNLADPGGRRFLRINVRLLVPELEEAEHIQENEVVMMRIRAAVLELLTEQTAEQMVAAEGKAALKAAIAEHATHILEPMEVSDVLFSDLVVQY